MRVSSEDRKDSIIDFLAQYGLAHGYAPSIREIAENEGVSLSNCYRIVQQMIRDGEVKAVAGRARTWQIVADYA